MSNVVAKINCYVFLAEWDQEELENCKVGLAIATLGSGFNHTSELHKIKDEEEIKWTH